MTSLRRSLACACAGLLLAFPGATSFAAQGGDLAQLEKDFQSGDARAQRKAVQELAALDDQDAWEFIVERALPSSHPRVADEAQLQLGTIDDEESLDKLIEALRSKSPLIRARAWEALGRVPMELPEAVRPYGGAEKHPVVLRTIFWSLQQRESTLAREMGGRLTKRLNSSASRSKDPYVKAAAIELIGALHGTEHWIGDGAKIAKTADASKHPAPRMALLRADPSLARVTAGLADESAGMRILAIDLAGSLGKPGALLLVDAFESSSPDAGESSQRVRRFLRRTLESISGKKHGASAKAWRAWATELPDDWKADGRQTSDRKPDAAASDEGQTTAFVGHSLHTGRVIFLIDMSGSMWTEKDGASRKERCEAELRTALEGLPKDARFSVLPFASEPAPWKPELTDATPKNVAKAIKEFESSTLRGKGDFWTALGRALECEEADTIVVLTDGAPSGGERWNLELMKRLWQERNRHRMVALEVLLFEPPKALVRHWEEMAAFGGGACVEVEF